MNTVALILLLNQASTEFKLPKDLLASICYVESTLNANAVHHDDGNGDSLGLCQIKYSTAEWLGFKGSEHRLMDPRVNAYYAGKYLRKLIDRYEGDVTLAVIAYNMGSTRGFTETKYSQKVMRRWRLNEGKSPKK
jgi:soluble lytic murein transglycosylase-like protein